ncbi:hypothetical protein [Clostridium botulinum]|uniref:hypothetical protein n=1 Tax=Clostridium botulinum TaxID=1491 RepID=UPI0008DC1753|nr:hypothetical protein [Clostridium botulinum]OOV52141.1 hypothetical protein B1A66_05630 [Clostridium botulinum D/C]OOV56873.1 hypothetical protein B1A67_05670 [Clostridium botulinum D/C]OOV58129.1 hypothetical protein B1A68_07415 [Clostridium botulinum D/C]OOV58490.1 hypothetical protein B0673_02360 [Clostridium botulinum D/C]OOV62067.1 hypothetical protein B1A69_06460 [Clostridium botulinum D/C]
MNSCNSLQQNVNCCSTLGQDQDYRVLSVLNYGAFIATVIGHYYVGSEYHEFEDDNLYVLQEFRLNLPLNATNIHLRVDVADIFRFEYTVFTKDYAKADDNCFLLWGLSFAAQYKQIPCTSPGMLQEILPKGVIVPYDACLNSCCRCTNPCINPCTNPCINPYVNPCINSCVNNMCNINRSNIC